MLNHEDGHKKLLNKLHINISKCEKAENPFEDDDKMENRVIIFKNNYQRKHGFHIS